MLKYLITLAILDFFLVCNHKENVCKSFSDYHNPEDNPNCWYDPDIALTKPEIIEKYAGTVQAHKVQTEDGYILTLFRIPQEKPKGVILLHHSIATDSQVYLWKGNNSLALNLWRKGYDVWLANQRGTSASNGHINMTTSDFQYWNYSFEEIGTYDVSSEISLIREKTNNSKIIYFGHSLGSVAGLVYASMKPAEAEQVLDSMILVAPAAFFKHTNKLLKLFKGKSNIIEAFTDHFKIGTPIVGYSFIMESSEFLLRQFPTALQWVSVFVEILCGNTPEETNPEFYNFGLSKYFNIFSTKTLIHFLQLIDVEDKFQRFDYEPKKNLALYGQITPPEYPIGDIKTPVLIVSSEKDSLVSYKDTQFLYDKFSPKLTRDQWLFLNLNHLDYLFGKNGYELFLQKLLQYLSKNINS